MSRTFLPNEDKRVGSISDLQNLSPETKHVAIIEGETSPADGGANLFWWDSSGNPANADGKSIVASNVESVGVWRRIVTPNPNTTDDLVEGSTNTFYTDERAQDATAALLNAGNGVTLNYDVANNELTVSASDLTTKEVQDDAWDVLTGSQTLIDVTYDGQNDEVDFVVESNLSNYTNDAGFITDLSSFTTDDLLEGSTNLYFTNGRVDDRVNNLLVGGTNVTLTYDDGANTLTIDSPNTQLSDEDVQDAVYNNVLSGNQTLISVSYDNGNNEVDYVVESNLSNYTNDAGFITDLSSFTTDDLAEGSTNLYFTGERVDDRVNNLLVGGTNVTLTYDDGANSLTIDSSDTQLSDEEVQDAVYNNVLSGTQTLISVSYDNGNNEVDYVVESNLSNYTNDAGFITDLSSFTTDDLLEGSTNLYYTDSRVDNEVRRISPTNQATFDGGSTSYNIPHGLGEVPKSWHVTAASNDAAGFDYVDADATNLIVNYSSATPAGSQNVVLNWTANKNI